VEAWGIAKPQQFSRIEKRLLPIDEPIMSLPTELEDLLRPTLTEADNATEFNKPWNPIYFVYVALIFGLAGPGIFLTLNWRRLGAPQYVLRTLVGSLLFSLLSSGAYGLAIGVGLFDGDTQRRFMSLIWRVADTVVAYVIAQRQSIRYRMIENSGQPRGSGVVAVVLSIGISIAVGYVLTFLSIEFGMHLVEGWKR
jgi:hypothetical protein